MNKIEKLIQQHCPNGVEFKKLGELGNFENIGVDKKIVEGQKKIMLLNFMDIMRNKHIKRDTPTMEVTASDAKIEKCDIKQYDIFITPSSETRDEIGFSAVVDEDIPNAVYSYHIMRYRLNEKNNITPYFINYLFESENLRKQIFKASKGLTRFGLSGNDFAKLQISVPPLEVQQEIVNILDKFTSLEAELEAELEARRAQYEHYRNALLTFTPPHTHPLTNFSTFTYKTLGEICMKTNNIKWKENEGKKYAYIDLSSVSRDTNEITETQTINSDNAPSRAQQIVRNDDVIFGTTRPTLKRYCFVTDEYDEQICSTGFCVLRANKEVILPKYLFFILTTTDFYNYVENNQEGAGYPAIPNSKVFKYRVAIPPITEQSRIVAILDKFEALVNDISVGLPAEIKMRRQQYEYYRNKLLTFKEAA